jgi:hypothetical protein
MALIPDDTRVSDCEGRVGTIIDTARDLFNETAGGFITDAFILRSINRCQQDIAQEDYWRRETWIPSVSGTNEIDLLTVIPQYQNVHQLHFVGCREPMTPLGSFQEYQELKADANTPGLPQYYVVQNNTLYVWPPPDRDLEAGFCIYHSYLPDSLTCSAVNPNPLIPKAHDLLFVYFVLKQAFLRDRHAPGADMKFQEYAALYDREKQKLLAAGDPPGLALRSYR